MPFGSNIEFSHRIFELEDGNLMLHYDIESSFSGSCAEKKLLLMLLDEGVST